MSSTFQYAISFCAYSFLSQITADHFGFYFSSRIWIFACRASQIHIINDEVASRSQVNSVFNSCVEARGVGLSLKLDYFVYYHYGSVQKTKASGRNYINLDLDTIWISKDRGFFGLPDNIIWTCGKCHGQRAKPPCGTDCLSSHWANPKKGKRLAINLPTWVTTAHASGDVPAGSLTALFGRKVEGILFVVGHFEQHSLNRNINFVAPNKPRLHVRNSFMHHEEKTRAANFKTWSQLEEDLHRDMRDCKAQREVDREEYRKELEEGWCASYQDSVLY